MRVSPVLSVTLLIGTGLAQQTTPDSNVVIRSSTREVMLEVVVRDAHGRLATKIDPAQVTVFEDGVRQNIQSFRLVQGSEVRAQDEKQMAQAAAEASHGKSPAPASNALRTVNVVCLVMNDLTPDTRAFAFDAARKFVNNELRPDTFIGVFSMDPSGLRPVFPFSNNRENLLKAVKLAAMNQLPALRQNTAAMLNGLSLNTVGGPVAGPPAGGPASTVDSLVLPTISGPGGAGGAGFGFADGASLLEPLGTRGAMGVAVTAGLREIDALAALVRQLSSLPFQKTVLLMGTGLTRPPDQLEYWHSLITSANKAGITFYGLDVYGLGVCQDGFADCATPSSASAASTSLLETSSSLSRGQAKIAMGAEAITPRVPYGVNIGASEAGPLMESMHQTDFARFAVLSANAQEALRDLSEGTGGFAIVNTNNTDKLLARIMEDVDTHYEISYRPSLEILDGRFRKIEVKLERADLRVQTRGGYFALPDTAEVPLTPGDLAALRALGATARPHAFDFQSKAFRFRSEDGTSQYSIAFEVPIRNLTGTPEAAEKRQRFHASLLALVKNPQGEILARVSRDVPAYISDQNVAALRSDFMTYAEPVLLAAGRYTIETAVVYQEGNRASTNILEIDNRIRPGLALSDITLVHIVQALKRQPDPADPFEIPGMRASPFVSTALPAGAEPFIYFIVYPQQNSGDVPGLQAQFIKDGHVLATQNSALPAPDESGAIPMAIRAVSEPGDYEVRISVGQGRGSVERSLKYSIAAN